MWTGGILLLALIAYFIFKDEADSKFVTFTGREYETDPEKMDLDKVLGRAGNNRGAEVAELQRRMLQDGADLGQYGPAKDGIDGVFGKVTEAELMKLKGVTTISLNAYGAEASPEVVKPGQNATKELMA